MKDSTDTEDDQLTRIVSYLDGELDEAETLQVEQQLIEDPDLRDRAEKLSRTWSMLDELDEVSASQRFTQDTMTSIVAESTKTRSRKRSGRFRNISRFLSKHKIVPCFLAGLIGGSVGFLRAPDSGVGGRGSRAEQAVNETLLNNFDLLQSYARYNAVPGLTELRELNFPPTQSDESGNVP